MSLNFFGNFRKTSTRRSAMPFLKNPSPRERKLRLALQHLEDRLVLAALVNPGFEATPDFTGWTVNTGVSPFSPNVSFNDESGSAVVVRGPGAPEGNAYAHLSFTGDVTTPGDTGYGPSLQSSTFSAAIGSQISVTWRAAADGDDAAPRGRLFDAATNSPVATFFDTTIPNMGSTSFTTSTVVVPGGGSGNYYAVFEDGSYDSTLGNFVGADLDVDALGFTLQTSSAQENLYIRVDPNDSTTVQVWNNGGSLVATYANNSNLPLDIFGDGNNNKLIIDESYGIVNLPITFNGEGSPGAPGDTMLVVGTPGADTLTLTPTSTTTASMTIDGSAPYSFSNIEGFAYYGGAGNDTMAVDDSTSLLTTPITYDGDNGYNFSTQGIPAQGNGLNALVLTQTGGATQTSDTYSVGPNPGQGTDVITGAAGTQTIIFQNLAPVFDSVPATTLTVNATNANNAINYTTGKDSVANYFATPPVTDPAWGEVSVDNQEPMEFTGKTNLVINGQAGNDTINIANSTVPAGLTGTITVNGDDPGGTGSSSGDTLVFTGTSDSNAFEYDPTSSGAGQVLWTDTSTSTTLPAVSFNTVESLVIDGGSSSTNDTLAYHTLAGFDNITLTPGTQFDSGVLTDSSTENPTNFTPLTFLNLGAGGAITLLNTGGARADTLHYAGTNSSDNFRVDAAGDIFLNNQVEVIATGVSDLLLDGLEGDDSFNLAGPSPFSTVTLDGGDPSASDTVNLSAASGPVVVNLGNAAASTNTTITGYGGTVTLTGIEVANLDANGQGMSIADTSSSNLTYTPTGPSAGTFTDDGLNTAFNFTNIAGAIVFNPTGADNSVVVNGTANRDLFSILAGSATVTVTPAGSAAWTPITLGTNVQSVTALGLGGQDTFQVTPAAGIQFPPNNLDNLIINVDGGGSNNALVVQNAAGGPLAANQFVVVNRTSTTSGTVRTYTAAVQWPDINYVNITTVSPNVAAAGNLLIMGPDDFEPNNTLPSAAFLGSGSTIQVQNATIFPNNAEFPGVPADQDYYQVVAQQTGTLDFQVYFQIFSPALFPGGGNLNVQVLNAAGQVLGTSTGAFGASNTLASPAPTGARVRIPVVAGQSYFLRVSDGLNADGQPIPAIVNGYNATIINTPAPVPYDLELSRSIPSVPNLPPPPAAGAPDTGDLPSNAPADDTGRSQFDNVTNNPQPLIYIRLDDQTLLNDLPGNGTNTSQAPGTPPIGQTHIQYSDGTTPGFRIAVFDTSTPGSNLLGYATPTPDPANPGQFLPGLYQFMPTTKLTDGIHGLVAAVQMIDPQTAGAPPVPTETGFGADSVALDLTIDTVPPPVQFGITSGAVTSTGLAASSDSGVQGAGALPLPSPSTPSETTVTLSDKITNVEEPTFYGTAEANAIVKLYALDKNNNPVLLGQTTATPLDGTNADPNGQWTITSTVNLNDPTYFSFDGARHLYVTAEDLAGNVQPPAGMPLLPGQQLEILLDTTGPQITGVNITNIPSTSYNLFGVKAQIGTAQGNAQADQGPTPLISSLDIDVQDLPAQDAAFLREAIIVGIAEVPGGITLTGDANGVIPIQSITVVPPIGSTVTPLAPGGLVLPGQTPTDIVRITFASPLPDDRYTLTINDTSIVDVAGNDLDGESNAIQPNGNPMFPSGDGQPGGNFVARFTVDSRPEIGTYAAGSVASDTNGNLTWDPTNTDASNRDLTFTLGIAATSPAAGVFSPMGIHDAVFAGNFLPENRAGTGIAQQAPVLPGQLKAGFDKLAAYGYDPLVGEFRWLIDTNNDGVIDTNSVATDPNGGDFATKQPATVSIGGASYSTNGIPVAANFDGNPLDGDQIGLFTGTTWLLDTSNHHVIDSSATVVQTQLRGAPIVGDFNGDGIPDLATYLNGVFEFNFGHLNGAGQPAWSGQVDYTINAGFSGVAGLPVAADIDGDGITDIGLYEPQTSAVNTPAQTSEWFFSISNDPKNANGVRPIPTTPNSANTLNHPFSPTPVGSDIFAQFGSQTALPIVANLDPPVAAQAAVATDAIGPVLGTAAVSSSIQGQGWYSFSPLRSGTMTISASATTAPALSLYDANMNLISTGVAQVSGAVTAGTQYLVRVTGNTAAVDLNFANLVAQQTLLDVNQDGTISPADALMIINDLNSVGSHSVALTQGNPDIYLDTNLDDTISPADALAVINALNAAAAVGKVSSAASPAAVPAASPSGTVTPAIAAAPSSAAGAGTVVTPTASTAASSPSASVLATDAVFSNLASATRPTMSTNLQSQSAASTLSVNSPAVRKTSNSAGSSGADAV